MLACLDLVNRRNELLIEQASDAVSLEDLECNKPAVACRCDLVCLRFMYQHEPGSDLLDAN